MWFSSFVLRLLIACFLDWWKFSCVPLSISSQVGAEFFPPQADAEISLLTMPSSHQIIFFPMEDQECTCILIMTSTPEDISKLSGELQVMCEIGAGYVSDFLDYLEKCAAKAVRWLNSHPTLKRFILKSAVVVKALAFHGVLALVA